MSRRLHGIAASPGVAIGRVVVIDRRNIKIPRRSITSDEIEPEIARFHRATDQALAQLDEVAGQLGPDSRVGRSIIEVHQLILSDEALVGEVHRKIEDKLVNAEWALHSTVQKLGRMFEGLEDQYLRERRSDIDFVAQRLLRNLVGWDESFLDDLQSPSIIIAHDLSPGDTAEMLGKPVLAFVTEMGSKTSHTAIMARSLEIPAVVGLGTITNEVETGDEVVVDGLLGDVVTEPDERERDAYEIRSFEWMEQTRALLTNRDLPAETLDGHRYELLANIEFAGEAPVSIEHGADGVGLYRSEFLYVNRAGLPNEEEQYTVYRTVAETLAPRPVTLRTFDIGGDKFVSTFQLPEELNPALGLRAVRLGLRLPEVLKTQLKAMLRAAVYGNVRIMFPMISGVAEFRACLDLVTEASNELQQKGVEHEASLPIGCMIEVPSAVFIAEALALEADFFSIGTNDLIQYTLAIDRASEHVAHLYHPLHPAILRAIDLVVKGARKAGIPVGTCGAMAEEPYQALVLIGLGLDNLSITPLAIPAIKHVIRSAHAKTAKRVAQRAMQLSTAEAIEKLCKDALAAEMVGKNPRVTQFPNL